MSSGSPLGAPGLLGTSVVPSLLVIAIVSLPFLAALLVAPISRRLALRYPRRRRAEAVLVVLGSLLGTSIITGSLIVGDTIDRSIRAIAYEQLGPIDELVSVSGLEAGDALVDEVGTLADIMSRYGTDAKVLDGVLTITGTQVSVVGARVQPRAQLLEVDFAAARSCGGDPAITGIAGPGPEPGAAVITSDLAATTDASAGDTITVHVYGQPVSLTVDRVVDREGVAGFWTIDGRQQAYNVFVTPGSLAAGLAGITLPPSVEPPRTFVAFSNTGGVESGADSTDDAVALIGRIVGGDAAVQEVKRDVLTAATEGADSLTQLYFTMGMFAVAAGVLLLVNIFVMLADERRSQLGMLRALGMRRGSLVMAFATEGWLYALVSSAIGAVVGIGLGRVIAWRANAILTSGEDIYSLRLTFSYDGATVIQGLAIGLTIAVVTIVLTSVRISRLNVIAAIRDLPTGGAIRRHTAMRRVAGGVAIAAGAATAVAGFSLGNEYGIAVGPMLVAVGIGLIVVGRAGVRVTVTLTSAVVLAWGTMFVPVLGWLDVDGGIPIFLVQGLTMCAAAVALLMVHHKALGAWLSERFGGSLPTRIGLAYPVAKSFRTAMSLGMFAIVILTIVYLSFISLMFGRQTDRITDDVAGGFGLVVTSNPSDPVTAEDLLGVGTVDDVAPLAYSYADFEFAGRDGPWPLTGFGAELLRGPPALTDLGDHATEAEAWRAVLADPTLVIVDEFFLADAGPADVLPSPGDEIVLTDPVTGNVVTLEVAAIVTTDFIAAGAYIGDRSHAAVFGDRSVASRYYVSASDLDATAVEVGRAFAANGAEARVVRDTVDALLAQNTGFFTLMQQFVGVGLLVGIAGLGVVMIRSVRERRREVGVLRAIGFAPRPVTRSFLLEAVFVATEGVLIGIVVAFIGTYGLVLNGSGFMEGFRWAVPWRDVVFVAVLTILASGLTAAIPSRRAGSIRPAQALRTVD